MILSNFKCDSGGDMRLTFRNGGASGADITSKHDSRYWYISSSSGWTQGTASANANYVVLANGRVLPLLTHLILSYGIHKYLLLQLQDL